jgi:hypothetical protein
MANSNNRLKAYVRYDGTGRVIAGSLILQRFKPKIGNWHEIPANECCNPLPTLVTDTVPGTFPVSYISVTILCDGSGVATVYTEQSATNMTELLNVLNTNEGTRAFGTYSAVNATTVQLSIPLSVKNNFCPDGTLSFNLFED